MSNKKKFKLHKKVQYQEAVTDLKKNIVEEQLNEIENGEMFDLESNVEANEVIEETLEGANSNEEEKVEDVKVEEIVEEKEEAIKEENTEVSTLEKTEEKAEENKKQKFNFKNVLSKMKIGSKKVATEETSKELEENNIDQEEVAAKENEETDANQKSDSSIKKAVVNIIKKNNLNKLGQFKLVFDVANINDLIHLSIKCFDIDFTGFKVKSVETLYNKTINMKSDSYEADVYLMISEIKELLKEREINKPVIILNYISNLMFFESMTIPKLSANEANKSIQMNLVKSYPEFQKKYVYDVVKFASTNHSNTYYVAMVEMERYRKVLNWFKELKLNITDVSLSFDSVRRMITKFSQLPKKHNALIINMKENHTVISSFDGKKIEGLRIAIEGYNNLIKGVANYLEIKEAKLLKKLSEGATIDDLINKRDQRTILRRALPEVLLELRRVVGQVLLTHKIDDIYLNVEGFECEFLNAAIGKYFKTTVRNFVFTTPDINNNLSSYGALLKANKVVDFNYPTKLRN